MEVPVFVNAAVRLVSCQEKHHRHQRGNARGRHRPEMNCQRNSPQTGLKMKDKGGLDNSPP